jgi:hypothetical protein
MQVSRVVFRWGTDQECADVYLVLENVIIQTILH